MSKKGSIHRDRILPGVKRCPHCILEKSTDEFSRDQKTGRFRSWCKNCISEYNRGPGRAKRYIRARNQYLRATYGLRQSDVDGMMVAQDSKCAICRMFLDDPHIDHPHKSEDLRGLLCHSCNTGLGHFKDDPTILRSAIEYLRPAVEIQIL